MKFGTVQNQKGRAGGTPPQGVFNLIKQWEKRRKEERREKEEKGWQKWCGQQFRAAIFKGLL